MIPGAARMEGVAEPAGVAKHAHVTLQFLYGGVPNRRHFATRHIYLITKRRCTAQFGIVK